MDLPPAYEAKIPRDPSHCKYCVGQPEPCSDHQGPDGKPAPYDGPNVYLPSEGVLEVIGQVYRGGITNTEYLCTGYDPRSGFWMETTPGQPFRRTTISERAIGRTFHQVRPKS